jgi:hypothetical protein
VRLPNLGKEEKAIFKHLDADSLGANFQEQIGIFSVVVITDGVSACCVLQDLRKILLSLTIMINNIQGESS